MKVLLDTSVLLAAFVEKHEFHARAYAWLEKVHKREVTACICQHTIAELYSTLTSIPIKPRIFPEMAAKLIRENLRHVGIVSLAPKDYWWCVQHLSDAEQSGGVIYDALAARAAIKSSANHLITFDPDDFHRVLPPEYLKIILVPS